jgi:hypothetical protein
VLNEPSGSVEIVHPFHPLLGKRFPILKARCVGGVDCLILQGSQSGTFSVPRDWTDRATPDEYRDASVPPLIVMLDALMNLAQLLNALQNKNEIDS